MHPDSAGLLEQIGCSLPLPVAKKAAPTGWLALMLGWSGFFLLCVLIAMVSLVIGNSAYENAPVLANPANDAADIAAALRDLDFTVVEGLDLKNRQMRDKIREFTNELRGADVDLFAPHGLNRRLGVADIPVCTAVQALIHRARGAIAVASANPGTLS